METFGIGNKENQLLIPNKKDRETVDCDVIKNFFIKPNNKEL